MNKKLKIASAAVAVVMAGTMAFGMFGCSGGSGSGGGGGDNYTDRLPNNTTSAAEIVQKLSSKASLGTHVSNKNNAWQRLKAYSEGTGVTTEGKQAKLEVAESYPATTELKFDIGDDAARAISFANGSIISGTVTLPDGKSYTTSSLKPAWAALENSLNLKVKDAFSRKDKKIETADTNTTEGGKLGDRDLITDGVETINQYSTYNDNGVTKYKLLDLSNYLEEMPNYAKFLEDNPVVQLSLTSNVTTGAMYAAPYFDGNDDIEKYVLFKKNWCESLLDAESGDTTTTFRSHADAKSLAVRKQASIKSFMGQTGKYNTTVLDKDGEVVTAGIDVNYDKALAAAKNESSPLGAAIKAAAGVAYEGESGNIVDLMNFAINTKEGKVTGAQLLKIMQEYIKVTYYVGGTETAFYTQTGYKLSDVFNGYCAAWDVDLYAALGRVLVTNPSLVKSGNAGNTIGGANATTLANLYLVANRQGNMQRQIDTTSFVGELYGVRGLESRNMYSYIDANGELQDPRADLESYEAFKAFSAFYAEGLATEKGNEGDGATSFYVNNTIEAMSYHDYSNTQTPGGFQLSGIIADGTYALEEGYNFTSILTPISKWNTQSQYNADYTPKYDTYMRFTESWRSVKNTGFAIPLDAVKNNPQKLKAVLSFIDYLFSPDGQIEMSYGPMASDANSTDGFWYNPEATTAQVNEGKYFTYKGKNYYSDVYYANKYQPTVTQKVKDLYYGREVNGVKADGSSGGIKSCVRSYTNFARYVIGSALPIGNKLQSFEYQMTSDMGLEGAKIVSKALDKGVIKHVTPDITGGDYGSPWYACVPTLLPYTEAEKATNTAAADVSQFAEGKLFTNNKGSDTNLYWEIIKYGYDAAQYNKNMCGLLELTGMAD